MPLKMFHTTGHEVIKIVMLNLAEHDFSWLINLKSLTIASVFLLCIAEMKISLLINMKIPTFTGIFIFISRENFILR